MNKRVLYGVLFLIELITTSFHSEVISWKSLEKGLDYASITLPEKSIVGDSKVDILKINPDYFVLDLICAEQKKSDSKKINMWGVENNLIAAVNAGMFKLEGDFKTCTGYMKNYSYVNNNKLNPSYKSILAFNPKDTALPKAQIIDLQCQDWNILKNKYNTFSQGIRMINCDTKCTWQKQEKNGAWYL